MRAILLLFLFGVGSVFGQVPTDDIKRYTFLNGLQNDVSPGTYDAYVGSSSPVTYSTGIENIPNSAYDYTASQTLFLSNCPVTTNVFTYSFWIKSNIVSSTRYYLIDNKGASSSSGISTWLQNGVISYYCLGKVGTTPTALLRNGTINVANNQWNHVVVRSRVEGTNIVGHIFVNGVQEAATWSMNANNVVLRAGETEDVSGNAPGIDFGEIDNIQIFTRGLTDNEIFAIYEPCKLLGLEVNYPQLGQAQIIWGDNGSNWDVEYKNVNDASYTAINAVAQNNYLFSSLTPGLYETRVRKSDCDGAPGNWSEIKNFRIYGSPSGPLYVNKNAIGANNGLTWQDAMTNLSDAMENIEIGSLGNTPVWVAAGTYIPTKGIGNKKTFNLPHGIKLFGGFNGAETLQTQRNPSLNITILSGDINQDDNTNIIYTEATRQDNAYHVLSLRGMVQNVIVDGFTISGGNANGATLTTGAVIEQYYDTRGGAVYANPINSSDFQNGRFVNCLFEKNTGQDVAVFASYYPTGGTNLTTQFDFESCIVKNNNSRGLGAFLFYGSANAFSNAKIENCLFYENKGYFEASCIYVETTGGSNIYSITVDINNSTFALNGVVGNGNDPVIKTRNGSRTNVRNSIFWGNAAFYDFETYSGGSYPSISQTIGNIPVSGLGNLFTDPLFVDAAANDFTLQVTSPAINVGNNSYVTTAEDLLGNQRIVNTTVDMGAYEYNPTLSSESFTSFSDFSIYPNPATSILNIAMNDEVLSIAIYSLDGKLVKETVSKQVDVSNLQTGFYIVKITTLDNEIGVKEFVKQ